jgi:hypothetical protein
MNCRDIKDMFPDYLIGDLDQQKALMVQAHLTDCADCRGELESLSDVWTKLGVLPEEQPGGGLRSRFYTMLEAYKQGMEQETARGGAARAIGRWLESWWPRRPALQFGAALLLLVVGLTAGFWLRPAPYTASDLAPLRQEVQAMQATLAMSLLDHGSASERLRGVSLSSRMERPDQKLLDTLVQTLDADPSVNVRLAVVDSLYLFHSDPFVRQRVSESLAKQTSPLVQVALIDLLVSMQERRAAEALKALIDSDRLDPEVRQRAALGLEKLL